MRLDWHQRFLTALRESRPAWDEPPDWRAALSLYAGLTSYEEAWLDQAVVSMISEDYRNPHSSRENLPFDDVMVNLPAGMAPDDLLCMEAAVLVAAERRLGAALFAFNRLLRAPRWHALYPRFHWLSYQTVDVLNQLAETEAGRHLGALVGLALGEALRPGPGGPEPGPWGELTERALAAAAQDPAQGPAAVLPAEHRAALAALLGGAGRSAASAPLVAESAAMEECLTRAVNSETGDAPIVGAQAGALYGPLAAPRRWLSGLQDRVRLETAAEAFYNACTGREF